MVCAGGGLFRGSARGIVCLRLGLANAVCIWVAKQRKPIVLEKDARKDPRFKFVQDIPEDRYQAFLSMPIINQDELGGVVNVRHAKPHKYPKGLVDLLATVEKLL